MALSIHEVRSLAQNHGYTEITHNETSKVVIFQKGGIKINVDYTTGTVGTCLNHPRQGKTQLFRRGVSLDTLNEIFDNPRTHTGRGYQLRENMVWMPLKSSNVIESKDEPECDLARRWRFVCCTTGLCDMAETEKIVQFCKLWNALEFEKGVDCKEMKNRRNGSGCALTNCLLEVARDHHGATGMLRFEDHDNERVAVDIRDDSTCVCDAGNEFQSKFEATVDQARHLLVSLDDQVRREVLVWFVGRAKAGNQLFGNDDELWWSRDDVSQVHHEYSLQYYPKKLKLCLCHGVR
mmetsp:Transcript_31587/g.57179  ORF Transcript_31587/g.57179 Transcript_31587/m.57179 type:complete len:293 (-) Transcript_31587:527-1405(-)|eukprot:CAMPEP_0202490578 /NCGR_PEP_ID=MMETSP1361-20130828/7939_1 /ASSEMBLY_ACC=CAM_ASM_000849 /TAXON_ID=210615 /ORGANISM="Staurosira complex sp., Strain CCMP2646" /LENGTH=292 /DNA_ID=CAMNT_0049120489 /DNA_START=333 /DNA_END=1211 /DNA_ORIENTATION=-